MERAEHAAKDSLTPLEGKGRRQEWAMGKVKVLYSVSLGSPGLGMFLWSCPELA